MRGQGGLFMFCFLGWGVWDLLYLLVAVDRCICIMWDITQMRTLKHICLWMPLVREMFVFLFGVMFDRCVSF